MSDIFKLAFDIPPSERKIALDDALYLQGSCFSDEIGARLRANKMEVLSNPMGTLYNPVSMFKAMDNAPETDRILESQGMYYHWDAHGKIVGRSPQEVEEKLDKAFKEQRSFLRKSHWLIMTLGSAMVYERKDGTLVANCHKRPASEFTKRFLSLHEIISAFNRTHTAVKKMNPKVQIILTVSPVRHLRDGLIENNRSKSMLLEATHSLVSANEYVTYFPSYEIVMDELRDYRFFKPDFAHPTEQAVDYVWEKFKATYFSIEDQQTLAQWARLRRALEHRPLHGDTPAHRQFLKKTLVQLHEISKKIDVSTEIAGLNKQISIL